MTGTVQGREVAAAIYEETVFNSAASVTAGERLYFRTMDGGGSRQLEVDDTISGLRGAAKAIAGNQDVQIPIACNVAAESIGRLLKSLMGAPTTTGSDPYTHKFDLLGAVCPTLIIEKDYGTKVTGAKRFIQHRGCAVNEAAFEFKPSGFIGATFNLLGASTVRNLSAALDASPDDFGHEGFSMFDAAITLGGSPIAIIQSLSVQMMNNLDADTFVIGGGGARGSLDPANFGCKGSMGALFQDVDIIEDADALAETAITVTVARGDGLGSAGNESFKIVIPHLLFNVKDPGVTGPGGMRYSLDFESHRDGASENGVYIELKNQRATY